MPVTNPIHSEDRLVVFDQEYRVRSRDVAMIDDRELRPVHRVTELDPANPAPRGGTSDGCAPQAAFDHEVVDVQLTSGEFGEALDALHVSLPARVRCLRRRRDRTG